MRVNKEDGGQPMANEGGIQEGRKVGRKGGRGGGRENFATTEKSKWSFAVEVSVHTPGGK